RRAADERLLEAQRSAAEGGGGLEDAPRLRHDFGTDAIAGEERDRRGHGLRAPPRVGAMAAQRAPPSDGSSPSRPIAASALLARFMASDRLVEGEEVVEGIDPLQE